MKVRIATLALSTAFLASTAAAVPAKDVRKTVALDADGTVELKTYKGTITVTTSDRKDVEIHARIEADPNGDEQDAKVEATKVVISGSGRSVEIESDYSAAKRMKTWSWFGGDVLPLVHYTVRMPAGARLKIDDYKSDIKLEGVAGGLDLETYKGTVNGKQLRGATHLTTYKGEVKLSYASFDKASEFETYKGEIEVRVPRSSRFSVDTETGRRGDFRSDFDLTGGVARTSRRNREESVRGDVNGGGPKLKVGTYKGTVRLVGE